MEDIKTAFTRARSSLLLKQPFFGTLCLRLGAEFTEDIPTAGTNGEKLLINPTFFLKQTHEQRVGLLAHEVMHCVYMHVLRLNERDPFLWNVAGDYVINLVVTDAGMIFSIYSSTPMLGERVELGDTYAVDGSDEKLSNYDNKYNNIDKCDDHNNGCEVKLFSSFSRC